MSAVGPPRCAGLAAPTAVLVLVLASTTVQAFHRFETETRLEAPAESLDLDDEPTASIELVLRYEYPRHVPSAHEVETRLEAVAPEPLAVETQPSRVPHDSVSNPQQRDADEGAMQTEEAAIAVTITDTSASASASGEVTVWANTTGTLTLPSSRDRVNVTVSSTASNANETDEPDELSDQQTSETTAEAAGEQNDGRTVPGVGPAALAVPATAAALHERRRCRR